MPGLRFHQYMPGLLVVRVENVVYGFVHASIRFMFTIAEEFWLRSEVKERPWVSKFQTDGRGV